MLKNMLDDDGTHFSLEGVLGNSRTLTIIRSLVCV